MERLLHRWCSVFVLGALLLPALVTLARPAAAAELDPGQTIAPAAPPPLITDIFQRTWARSDRPVAENRVSRTWMWGPPAGEPILEPYVEAVGRQRWVQYYDKTRMEDNSWRASPPWDVTNGLLAFELLLGVVQEGDSEFCQYQPAQFAIAGDPDPSAPTYATFRPYLGVPTVKPGEVITKTLTKDGFFGSDPLLAEYGVTAEYYVPDTKLTVASVFWEFMNSTGLIYEDGQYVQGPLFPNPFYATGFPITDPIWVHVKVKGVQTWVLVQVFQRRVLTYTPSNPDGWRVESGNVGQHYVLWRYTKP